MQTGKSDMLESEIEKRCCAYAKKLGFESIKLTSSKGLPDRMFLSPSGSVHFVEFKTKKGVVSEHQKAWHKRLNRKLHCVHIIRSVEQFKTWIEKI